MKRSSYERKVNEIKAIITRMDRDIYDTAAVLYYLAGYMPEAPIGVCTDALVALREEQYK